MSNIYSIDSYTLKSTDAYVFDNNIWMYIFCPMGNYSRGKQSLYSNFLTKATTRKIPIWINSLILSEFCNSWLRLEFEAWKEQNKTPALKFKADFIGSPDYIETTKDITTAINSILKVSQRNTDDFHIVDMPSIFDNFSKIDLNDCYYIELARQKNWKIVTDDNDFTKANRYNVDIITANIK